MICPKDVGLMQALAVSYGMAWELLTLHRSLVRMRRSALRCPHFPRRPGAQVECRNQRLLMLTSAVLETSVATGCHPSGLLPPQAGDNGGVNGLSVSPPSQSLQAVFFYREPESCFEKPWDSLPAFLDRASLSKQYNLCALVLKASHWRISYFS